MFKGLLGDMGLAGYRPFHRDRWFMSALLAGLLVWLLFWQVLPGLLPVIPVRSNIALLLSLMIWQPVLEELLFRGFVQGQIRLRAWGREQHWGMTNANLLTSLLFALAHAVYHTPLWAVSVFVPALVFGFFRDRYRSVYPSVALHVYYNAGYYLLGALVL